MLVYYVHQVGANFVSLPFGSGQVKVNGQACGSVRLFLCTMVLSSYMLTLVC